MANTVVTPDGTRWRVKRRWMPHRKLVWRRAGRNPHAGDHARASSDDHWYLHFLDFLDIADIGDLGGLGTAIAVILGIIAALLLLWFLVIPALLLLVDVIVVVLLVLVGVLAHTVLRRPWEIEASCGDQRLTWLVGGWRPSHDKVAEVAASFRAGRVPGGNTAR